MEEYKFYAFISYRRGGEDEKVAKWLQRRLESYRVPVDIADRLDAPADWDFPERLTVFRDRTDLGAHVDLTEGLARSLKSSRFLIVVCSPRSAASPWVEEEVRFFQDAGRSDRIVPFIIEGAPEPLGEGGRGCYPPSLPASVLGVDLADGTKEEALIKTIARLLRVDYADLYRRHVRAERRFMLRTLVASFAVLALMAGLAVWALLAERKVAEQRREAEGLVRFLVFDMAEEAFDYIPIRARVRIAEKVQEYYDKWGTWDAGSRYAMAKHLMDLATTASMAGNKEENRHLRYKALSILEELRAGEPDNETYLELYGQILRQVGSMLKESSPDSGADYYRKSLDAARGFVRRNPDSPTGRKQEADALEALASRAVIEGRPDEALTFFEECVAIWEGLLRDFPQLEHEPYYIEGRANLYSLYSHFFRSQEKYAEAAAISETAIDLYASLLRQAPGNLSVLSTYGDELDNATMLETRLGNFASADAHYREGGRVRGLLLERDPDNAYYRFQMATNLAWGGVLRLQQNKRDEALVLLNRAEEFAAPLLEKQPKDAAYRSLSDLIRIVREEAVSKTKGEDGP